MTEKDNPNCLAGVDSSGARRTGCTKGEGPYLGATAVGALALGALAVGALAIGKLAVGQLALGRARLRRGKVDDLLIARLTIEELRIERALGSGSVDRRRCPVRRGWIRIVRGVTYVRTARNAVALMVLMALAVTGRCVQH